MKPFCEVIVREVLPATRSMIAIKLTEKGLSGKEIATKIGVTPAAVTQYLRGARGKNIMQDPFVREEINKFVESLMKEELNEKERMKGFCRVCKAVRERGLIYSSHLKRTNKEAR